MSLSNYDLMAIPYEYVSGVKRRALTPQQQAELDARWKAAEEFYRNRSQYHFINNFGRILQGKNPR